jgi:hypothetical protein
MAVQNVSARTDGGLLDMMWEVLAEPVALSIQMATDNEFTSIVRTFVIPTASGATLDIGNGTWFFRIGAWMGSKTAGKITWTSPYGPATIATRKAPVNLKPCTLPLLHVQSIQNGIRLHTGLHEKAYLLVDYCKNSKFPASQSTSLYMFDWGRGYFDVDGLDFLHKYSIRFASFAGSADRAPVRHLLPTETVAQLEAPRAIHNAAPGRPARPVDNGLKAVAAADDPILREAQQKPFMRFASHADYLRYTAAVARTSDTRMPATGK